MQDPTLNVFAVLTVTVQKPVNEFLDSRANHFRNVFGQNDVEAGVSQVKSHGTKRVWKRVSLRDQDLQAGSFLPGVDNSCRTASDQNRRDQVGLGNVFTLEGERGKFHGDN